MNYCTFVLGYDLLHDVLDGLECDVAYDFCVELYNDFKESIYNNPRFPEYECLQKYINDHINEIKAKLEELR
jgi:hypothetical protein